MADKPTQKEEGLETKLLYLHQANSRGEQARDSGLQTKGNSGSLAPPSRSGLRRAFPHSSLEGERWGLTEPSLQPEASLRPKVCGRRAGTQCCSQQPARQSSSCPLVPEGEP